MIPDINKDGKFDQFEVALLEDDASCEKRLGCNSCLLRWLLVTALVAGWVALVWFLWIIFLGLTTGGRY